MRPRSSRSHSRLLSPQAKPVAKNLGGGLAEIATTEGRAKSLAADAKGPKVLAGRAGNAELSHPVVFDKAGRPLVRITLDGRRSTADVLKDLSAIAGVEVRASNAAYRKGVIEAYVPAASLAAIAKSKGIRAVVPVEPDVHATSAPRRPPAGSCIASTGCRPASTAAASRSA